MRSDSNLPFKTSNYDITTTPALEWEITTQQNESKADMRHKRRLPNPKELLQSDVARNAGLTFIEVIVIVLYTGPMVRRPAPPHNCTGVHPCPSGRTLVNNYLPAPLVTAAPCTSISTPLRTAL